MPPNLHVIYCGEYSYIFHDTCLDKMKKYGMQSLILTSLSMIRKNLITKEKSKQAYKGELKNDEDWKYFEGSINDDLETFVVNLREGEIQYEEVRSFFLPKLSKEELQLIDIRDEKHLKTYSYYLTDKNVDVDVEEMKRSDSKDKYVKVSCRRETILLTIDSARIFPLRLKMN